jgi:histidinol-phosphate/aromatic aminotransferase/cobyric acid decarboxylase-like protein
VWDEAFWPLATGSWTRGDHRRGAVVVGSLTKLLACPGLRVGYVLSGDADLLGRLRAAQPEWSVNGLVCSALPELLAPVDLAAWRDHVVDLRAGLADLFRGAGFTVRDTAGPWVLVDGASWLRDALIAQRVVTRDCTSFGMPGTLRVAVPRPTDLPNLRAALAAATAER